MDVVGRIGLMPTMELPVEWWLTTSVPFCFVFATVPASDPLRRRRYRHTDIYTTKMMRTRRPAAMPSSAGKGMKRRTGDAAGSTA